MKIFTLILLATFVCLASANLLDKLKVPKEIKQSEATEDGKPELLKQNSRIVGGIRVNNGEAPYHVAIYEGISFICNGALVSPRIVLTSATCVQGLENFQQYLSVRYGSLQRYGPNRLAVSRVIVHENFQHNPLRYDIAILLLDNYFTPSINAAIIDLATSYLSTYSYVQVTGWGLTQVHNAYNRTMDEAPSGGEDRNGTWYHTTPGYEDYYSTTETPPSGNQLSSYLMKGEFRVWSNNGNYGIIDSSGQSLCLGDGGAPITQNGVLVGIAQSRQDCRNPNSNHNFYATYVYGHQSWILDNAANPK